MSTTTDDALVSELARDAVAVAAPAELPLFGAASRRYFDDPDAAETPTKGGDEMLGFGLEAAAILITPVALCVARAVVRFVTGEVARATKEESRALIHERVRRLFRRGGDERPEDADEPGLTDQQLVEVRRVAVEKATALGVPAERAGILADAMVGSLATAGA